MEMREDQYLSLILGCFTSAQQYAILVLADGGNDLESFKFSTHNGWVEAASVFWQVVASLAKAEEEVEFEVSLFDY